MKLRNSDEHSWLLFLRTTGAVVFIWLVYAIVRYVVGKGTSIDHIPLFILNKVFSSTAATLIGLSMVASYIPLFAPIRKYLGLGGFASACIHAILSTIVLTPSYFPEYHTKSGQLNVYGETAILFGASAFVLFLALSVSSIPSVYRSLGERQQKGILSIGHWGFILVMLHVFVLGIRQWIEPSVWPLGMLPISMAVFSVLFVVLLIRLLYMVRR